MRRRLHIHFCIGKADGNRSFFRNRAAGASLRCSAVSEDGGGYRLGLWSAGSKVESLYAHQPFPDILSARSKDMKAEGKEALVR